MALDSTKMSILRQAVRHGGVTTESNFDQWGDVSRVLSIEELASAGLLTPDPGKKHCYVITDAGISILPA